MKILFLAARLPYPPLHGDEVRGYHQLRLLSQRHEITLLSFIERGTSPSHVEVLRRFCREIVTVPRQRVDKLLGCVRGLCSAYPVQTLLYRSPAMEREV